jgi:hypothetical protein
MSGDRYKMARHWRRMWKIYPENMQSNLEAIIQNRKQLKDVLMHKAANLLHHVPATFPARESKKIFTAACMAAGVDPTPDRLMRIRIYAVRYGMLRYSKAQKLWINQIIDTSPNTVNN